MTTHRFLLRAATSLAATGLAAGVLTGCGGDDADTASSGHGEHQSSAPSSPSKHGEGKADGHNATDVAFAQGMVPHHRQAVEMAELADSRASAPEVKSLSKKIERAQGPEIRKMSGWLESWGEQAPEGSGMDHSGGAHASGEGSGKDHSEQGMSGMMSSEDMTELKKSSGQKFDTAFLRMMVEHHKGAVQMANTEKSKGSYGPAKALAKEITSAQNTEIRQMEKLLDE